MTEEYEFTLNKVNSLGLCRVGAQQSQLQERRVIELYESAEEIADRLLPLSGDFDLPEMLTFLSENLTFPETKIHEDALKDNFAYISDFISSLSYLDKVVFADIIINSLKKRGFSISEADFLQTGAYSESFTYVKNSLADEAYDVFCQEFSDPRLKYSVSLSEAAELVANDVVSYALLPLEEAGGERLHTASELIFKHDLKINNLTPVFGIDGSADMKYALVSRSFTIPKIYPDDDLYLEIRASTDSVSLRELLSAAEYFESSVYRINTIYFDTDQDRESYYSIVFKSQSRDFCGLLGYLTLFISSCTPVGIYKNLE